MLNVLTFYRGGFVGCFGVDCLRYVFGYGCGFLGDIVSLASVPEIVPDACPLIGCDKTLARWVGGGDARRSYVLLLGICCPLLF